MATVLLIGAPSAWASTDAEAQLAARFAPEIRLVDEPPQCGEGEPYVPIDVDGLFDQPTVALRGPWGGNDLVKVGPAAGDLAGDLSTITSTSRATRWIRAAPTSSGLAG